MTHGEKLIVLMLIGTFLLFLVYIIYKAIKNSINGTYISSSSSDDSFLDILEDIDFDLGDD